MKKNKIGSKGFTLIELLAVIVIISVIGTIIVLSVNSIIKSSKDKVYVTTTNNIKEAATTYSKELGSDYWSIDTNNNNYILCISVQDLINAGYFKENEFDNVDKIDNNTYVKVIKDKDNLTIISEEIDTIGYCSKEFNNASLTVTNYTDSTIAVDSSCESNKNNTFIIKKENESSYNIMSDKYTFGNLESNTKYNLSVECANGKKGNISQITGNKNLITENNQCTNKSKPININFSEKGTNYFFKIDSAGSTRNIVYECLNTKTKSCSSVEQTDIKANTWYLSKDKEITINKNNNGVVYTYSSNSTNPSFSTYLTHTVTSIDYNEVNKPVITSSDNISSGEEHYIKYDLLISGSINDKDLTGCNDVKYYYSNSLSDKIEDYKLIANQDNNGKATIPITEDGNVTYYVAAKNAAGTYSNVSSYNAILLSKKTTTFDANGGRVSPNNKIVIYNQKYGELPTPTRDGYTFEGWYTASSGGNKINSDTKVTSKEDHTLYAHWTANTYTVTFNANGGSVSPTTSTVTYGSTYGMLPTTSRTGYTFAGWYTASSGGSKIVSTTTVSITAAQTLYAHWTINQYTLTYDNNGGYNCSSKTGNYGSSWGTLCTPSRSGYTFNGWYTASSGGTQIASSSTVSGNKTIYAHWTENVYQINNSNYTIYSDNFADAVSKANAGATIYLLKNVTDTTGGSINKNITFDSNGYTLSRNTSKIEVLSGTTFTVQGSGTIEINNSNLFMVSGTLNVYGGSYKIKGGSNSSDNVIYINSSGNINIKDSNSRIVISAEKTGGCGTGIHNESNNDISYKSEKYGIYLYGSCYGIWSNGTGKVIIETSYNTVNGIENVVYANSGYAICAKGNITIGSLYASQNGSTHYYPFITSASTTTNSNGVFPDIYSNSDTANLWFYSGIMYTTLNQGSQNYQNPYFTHNYLSINDKYYGVSIGWYFVNKTIKYPSGYYLQYFVSTSGGVALRVMKS